MSSLAYEIVDVFTDRPFTGNPLAVVFGADDLATDQLQALAREFNLSETVFVLPPTLPGASYRARIFTPTTELPFAGHPSVGVAATQVRRGLLSAGDLTQECGAGLLPVHVYGDGRARLTGGKATVGRELDPAPLLAAVGLAAGDFAGPAARMAGAGLEWTYLPVQPDAVARARYTGNTTIDVCVFAWNQVASVSHARCFAGAAGVSEDAATGSAALGFGVWLAASGLVPADGESSYVVYQGAELLRPSTLECFVETSGGEVTNVSVTGSVVSIATGTIGVPPFVG
jgi:trans-2,3-dihydro-3-hydroxyanthranilate isomerase